MDSRILECLENPSHEMFNICIMAHIDHGKTTFADGLLSVNNWVPRQQVGKLRFLDSRPDEQERGITLKASSILLLLERNPPCLVNVIDTPGHVDLIHETAVAASLSDACFVLVDLVNGVAAQSRSALNHARRFGLRPILVLNKFDRLFKEKNVREYFEFFLAIEEIVAEANKVFMGNYFAEEEEEDKYFALNKNNVVFGSATDDWMCSIGHFERFLLTNEFHFSDESVSPRGLWSLEEFYVSPKLKSISQTKIKNHPQLCIQLLFDTIASFYDLENLPASTILRIYRKIMKKIDTVTDDDTLIRRFGVKEALPRLRKLLLETWMPLGLNCLEIISGEFMKEKPAKITENLHEILEIVDKEDAETALTSISDPTDSKNCLKYIQIAKLFTSSDIVVGLCKYLGNSHNSQESLSLDDKLYIGLSSVTLLDYCLMNGTRLVPVNPSILKPGKIFGIRFLKIGDGKSCPKETWKGIKDVAFRVGSVLINAPLNKTYKLKDISRIKPDYELSSSENGIITPTSNPSPVFKVIFLPKKHFLPGRQEDENDNALYQLAFKILLLSDQMLKIVLKPSGFWEMYFLGRLHYEKFTTDFQNTMLMLVHTHLEALGIDSKHDVEEMDVAFQRLNLIQDDRSDQDSSPLLVAFKESISENFFLFHARGRSVIKTIDIPGEIGIHLVPVFIETEIEEKLKETSKIDPTDLKRFFHVNKWVVSQIKAKLSDPENFPEQAFLLFSHKRNHLFVTQSEIDSTLVNYLKIGFKMAIENGGPLCEEPLVGISYLVHITTNSTELSGLDFQLSLTITDSFRQIINRHAAWYRLVVPLYQADAIVSADSPSYQTVCELVRRFDGKIKSVDEANLQFQLPVTESERLIEMVRKKCHGHVDVHFSFESEEDLDNWKVLDFVSEEKRRQLECEESPDKVKKLSRKKNQKAMAKDFDEGIVEVKEEDRIVEVLDEEELEDLDDLLEMYENMEKSRVQPLVAQMRKHKGLFEQHSFGAFDGEKQEKHS